jgi:hypothetical protein
VKEAVSATGNHPGVLGVVSNLSLHIVSAFCNLRDGFPKNCEVADPACFLWFR